MYVPVWLLVLVVAPWALYLVFGLAILLGAYALLALGQICDGAMRSAEWSLGWLVAPFKPLGPWFDYVAATVVLAALCAVVALLA